MNKQFDETNTTLLIKKRSELSMNETRNTEPNNGRRKLLIGGLAASAAGLLQACGGGGSSDGAIAAEETSQAQADVAYEAGMQSDTATAAASTVTTPSPIPSNQVNLADFGGVPGASGQTIISAFNQAFNRLKTLGGGTLNVGAGVYNLGSYSGGTAISVSDLKNVLISAYDAEMRMNTTANVTPVFFAITNPTNVTIAGMKFYDSGTNLSTNWRGAVCLFINSTVDCSGFKTVDCVADNVCTFLQSQTRSNRFRLTGFDVHATISNAYYGVNVNWNGRYSRCNINCTNVRRAVLMQAARNWDITVTTHRSGGLGSNAHVVFDTFADGPVQDCNVNIIASGALDAYNSIGSICHQAADGVFSYARNVKFNIAIKNATSAAATGFISFTAEPESGGGIRSTTVGAYETIEVRGTVTGSYTGRVIANPSVSSASTNSIKVADTLAGYQNMGALPGYFSVFTPPTQCSA